MLRGEPPYHLMLVKDIEECIEQLQIAIARKKIIFGLTHGAPTKGDTAYRWMLHFESITLIDDELLIRHEAHKPYITIVERQPRAEWNQTLDYRVRQMATLPRRTVHPMTIDATLEKIAEEVRENLRRP
jgi:hypothetical protein